MKNTLSFQDRHCGLNSSDLDNMLQQIGCLSTAQLLDEVIPETIRHDDVLEDLPTALDEKNYLKHIQQIANKNQVSRCFIGQGYYGTYLPAVIQRNILENPGWYTAYTPYQAEIAQGRLEALFNFQTMISDLTGFPISNASLLDEGTAAAEAVLMLHSTKNKKSRASERNVLIIDEQVFAQTRHVVSTKAKEVGIDVRVEKWKTTEISDEVFAVLVQYPDAQGSVYDYSLLADRLHALDIGLIACADLLSLAILPSPQSWGADVAVGTSQRFGVPMWFGGPHAAYFSCKEEYKRIIPGRIIGLSKDKLGHPAYRMALQTREQHIKREKATSNICTAQALLAIIAGMYAVHHGPLGLKTIAIAIRTLSARARQLLKLHGYEVLTSDEVFDTIAVKVDTAKAKSIKNRADEQKIEIFFLDNEIRFSFDELSTEQDLHDLLGLFGISLDDASEDIDVPKSQWKRQDEFLSQPVFHSYRSETALMRYIKSLENKDFSLVHGMIPLGSCTMKLNAAAQLLPLSWAEFANIHPMSSESYTQGYLDVIEKLGRYLCVITGLDACTFQPNSGAQGEYAGLLSIKRYHESNEETHRDVVLIPASAHGTNPASAAIAGLRVVVVSTDEHGNVDLKDLEAKIKLHADHLCALMITYPSTHGVYESGVKKVCRLVHDHGGLVYMDGANMNAQVGFTSPGRIGVDVCHLNLHKTFAIPHGGGGPGMGPICVNEKLTPFLPNQNYTPYSEDRTASQNWAISSAKYGSPSILLISYAYIRMLGSHGLKMATTQAILNANYLESKLKEYYNVLYRGEKGRVAHEFIIDLRPFKEWGIQAEDVAKRLMDYGFHAPTLSFPVPGTLMIEPTESENREELDRFCDALIGIRREIQEIMDGKYSQDDNVLVNAPHTLNMVCGSNWDFAYTREKAAFPQQDKYHTPKFWASVSRIDNAYGDRHLICTCPPLEDYEELEEISATS